MDLRLQVIEEDWIGKMEPPNPRTEQDIFDDLSELCGRPGFIHALAWISLRDNYVSFDGALSGEFLAASYAPTRTVRTEFSTLLGLLMRKPTVASTPTAAEGKALLDRTNELLAELHERLGRPMWDAVVECARAAQKAGSGQPPSPFTRADVLREPIFYGGESAYSFQYRDMALERYAADESWLFTSKGFTIKDGQAVAQAISKIQNSKILDVLSRISLKSDSFSSLLQAFTLTAEEIAKEAKTKIEKVRAVFAALSVYMPANADFTSLGEFNLANACPIIAQPDGGYIALQGYGIVESLYDSPFYWMIADKAYRATASAHRGSFTEQFVAKRLRAVFGDQSVHCNINIEGASKRVSEIDVLVLFGDRALIVQCKSKKMTLESRKGNDQTLREDFQKAVQDAYDQGLLCARSLGNSALEFVQEDGAKLTIPKLREIYIICAVSDHYPVLTVQARHFLQYEQDEIIKAPLIADVFLIDVITEMLASPLRFLSYINRRTGYAERIYGTNELAILGYHLSQNLWFEGDTGMAMVADECSLDLDTAMTVRREGVPGAATPKGILTKFKGTLVDQIIKKIEHEANPDLIDLWFLLLDISDDTIDELNKGLKDIAHRTWIDGRLHDLTLGFENGDSGLTIHCSRAPLQEAVETLNDHCERRKYIHRAKGWFGLGVREEDGLPAFSIALRFPWKYEANLDALTQAMVRKSHPSTANPVTTSRVQGGAKTGRNDPCVCGSGKKFKKCCLS